MNVAEERSRAVRKLQEQIKLLKNALDNYDRGDEAEAFNIATRLRVLFHDPTVSNTQKTRSHKSQSLLTQLGMRECPMFSTMNADSGKLPHTAFVRFRINFRSECPVIAVPRHWDEKEKPVLQSFVGPRFPPEGQQLFPYKPIKRNDWWEKEVVYFSEAKTFTRQSLVRSAADK